MRILEEFWYGNIEPTEYDTSSCKEYKKLLELICRNEEKLQATMTDEQKDLFEKYADCVREYQTITDCPTSRLTGQDLSQHESWVTISIKRLCSPPLSGTQNRLERKHPLFIPSRPYRTLSNSKTLSAVRWIWKRRKPRAKVMSIGQRYTTSKTQAEPMCCIKKWALTRSKHWLPPVMPPTKS